ncbi:MAG: class I SAM-dependent methyltransferase [Clostridia bacterium]|nr:class I SAM-dependent methyltransferase [Clostridia bacterium]
MHEKKHDKRLNIKTTGIREWRDGVTQYNRCEATPYIALEALFNQYRFNKEDQVVDFGSGRGRVAFYIHNRFHIPVTGIEMNDITLEEAKQNKVNYRHRAKHIKAPIRFKFGLAEQYEIKPWENKFYFFNPFSSKIFKKIVRNILDSLEHHERDMDIILYYPIPKYKKFLNTKTPFKLINKIGKPRTRDKNKKFLIYRSRIST